MTAPILIGLSGKAGSGKDTLGDHLIAAHGFQRVALADPLKQLAVKANPIIPINGGERFPLADLVKMFGWDKAKGYPEARRFLQHLGQGVRALEEDFWVNAAGRKIDRHLVDGTPVVLTDVRYANEAKFVESRGVLIRLERPGMPWTGDHPSETSLDSWPFRTRIVNDGSIEELHTKVDRLVTELAGEDRP